MEQLNLVQFHWWDYEVDRQVEVAGWLAEAPRGRQDRQYRRHQFRYAADAADLDAGVPLVSMQVQYSLIDDRPSRSMAAAAAQHGDRFLCYGSVGGGLFSERMLGAPEPNRLSRTGRSSNTS
jgi:aryl-alcohol dehydrogenase-like predicted oxidoreductase